MSDVPDETAIQTVADWLQQLQRELVTAFEALDGQAQFVEDRWAREEGGGGSTRVISDGAVFERRGVNFSEIRGNALPAAASAKRPELAGRAFKAMGVSVVMHPRNPYVPTSHMNVRLFVVVVVFSEVQLAPLRHVATTR